MRTWRRATQRHRSITSTDWASVPEGPGAWRGWAPGLHRPVSRALLCAGSRQECPEWPGAQFRLLSLRGQSRSRTDFIEHFAHSAALQKWGLELLQMISWVPGSGSFTVLCPVVGSKGGGKDRQEARKKICTAKLNPCVGVLGIHSPISTLDYKHPGRFVISFRFLPHQTQTHLLWACCLGDLALLF